MAGLFGKKENYVPASFKLKMTEALVLYYNLFAAKADKDVGYASTETKFTEILYKLNRFSIDLSKSELEELLWACSILEEKGKFWHPERLKVNDFIYRILHHKQYKFYFDKLYNFFRAKKPTRTDIGAEFLVSSEGEEK